MSDSIGEYYERIRERAAAAWAKVRAAEAEEPRDEAKIAKLREQAIDAGDTGD